MFEKPQGGFEITVYQPGLAATETVDDRQEVTAVDRGVRIVDPHQKTTAAQTFAARSAVIAPLLGGGLVTATMPLLVAQFGIAAMLAVSGLAMLLAWVWPGRYRATR